MNTGDERLTPVEQHLGDRLAALVDGELGHDARERVLAHLATCWSCKAEADAQRRLKSVFAATAPPPPSDGLLARLQGLPADGEAPKGSSGMPGADAQGGALPAGPRFGGARSPLQATPLPGGSGPSLLAPTHGARTPRHSEAERAASRSRRFAFAAAGAFSLAALALSGTVGSGTLGGSAVAAGERGGATAGHTQPVPTAAAASDRDREKRRRPEVLAARATRAATAPSPSLMFGLRQRVPLALAAAASRAEPSMATYSFFAPAPIRPPRVLPEVTPSPALPASGPTPAASAAPAPTPALPIAGPRP